MLAAGTIDFEDKQTQGQDVLVIEPGSVLQEVTDDGVLQRATDASITPSLANNIVALEPGGLI